MKYKNDGLQQLQRMKGIVQKILKDEQSTHQLNVDVYPITFIEYYKSDIFKKRLSLSQTGLMSILKPFTTAGFYHDRKPYICVFIRRTKTISELDSNTRFIDLIFTTYHEFRHRYQSENLKTSKRLTFELFAQAIEEKNMSVDYSYYNYHHDQFFIEIDANLYGTDKTVEFLSRNGKLNEKAKEYLEMKRKKFELALLEYDIQSFFSKFNKAFQSYKITETPFWTSVFYDENRQFKSIEQILNNPLTKDIDDQVLMSIFSSPDFLKTIDFKILPAKYQQIIMQSIKFTYNETLSKRKKSNELFNQQFASASKWLQLDNTFSNRIRYCLHVMSFVENAIIQDFHQKKQDDCYQTINEQIELETGETKKSK